MTTQKKTSSHFDADETLHLTCVSHFPSKKTYDQYTHDAIGAHSENMLLPIHVEKLNPRHYIPWT
jgi:hypothetical protein